MSNNISWLKKYPLSVLCILLIAVLSLVPFFPETPLDDIQFIDKWTHFVMYGGTCAVIWWEHLRCRGIIDNRFLWFTLAGMTAWGGLMELLQAYCTTTRSGEWLDFWSDGCGVLLGNLLGWLLSKTLYR